MVTGWQTIDGKEYYFGEDGIQRVMDTEEQPSDPVDEPFAPEQTVSEPTESAEELTDDGEIDPCGEPDAEAGS